MEATVPAVVQHREDWPGNPGWWRWGFPIALKLTRENVDAMSGSEEWRYYTCSSMGQARRWCGEDRAEWLKSYPNG